MSQWQLTQICTRANQGSEQLPPHKELDKIHKDLMLSLDQAREYLEKQCYVPPNMQGEKALLSYILLFLVHYALPNILAKAIRAVAVILENEETNHTANTVVVTVMKKLDPALDLMDHAADAALEAANTIRTVAD